MIRRCYRTDNSQNQADNSHDVPGSRVSGRGCKVVLRCRAGYAPSGLGITPSAPCVSNDQALSSDGQYTGPGGCSRDVSGSCVPVAAQKLVLCPRASGLSRALLVRPMVGHGFRTENADRSPLSVLCVAMNGRAWRQTDVRGTRQITRDWPDSHGRGENAGLCCGAEQVLCPRAPGLPQVLLVRQMVRRLARRACRCRVVRMVRRQARRACRCGTVADLIVE